MSFSRWFRPLTLGLAMLAGGTMAALPQVTDAVEDPPGRVGRLSYMNGTVSFRDDGESQWVPATLNFPVTSGDGFWTEPNSRAEIQIGSSELRLDSQTSVQFVRLDDDATQIQIDQGSINFRLRELPQGGVRLVTRHAVVVVTQPGRYHVDVVIPHDDVATDHVRIAVLEGAARIEGLASPLVVTAGHSAMVRPNEPYPLLAQAIALPLDTWALEREQVLNPGLAVPYISPEMTGVQDLHNYGDWVNEPLYGAVWYPRATAIDWAPYRYGHWAYVRPWGWTWIDHQPWGFAPFHYGRWVRYQNRWGWCPGERVRQPIYAPALVVFASSGGSSVLLLSSGRRAPAVGWAPLGFREPYRPYYRHSPSYGRNINITQVQTTNITVINRDSDRDGNRTFRNRPGLTVVAAESFTGATAVERTRVTLRDNDWTDARRAESLDHLTPSRSARAGLVVPVGAPANDNAARTAPQPRQRHGERDDDRRTPLSVYHPPANTAAVPTRDPNILPKAPGPERSAPNPEARTPATRAQDRAPALSPLDRNSTPPGRTATIPVPPPGRATQPNSFERGNRDSQPTPRAPAAVPKPPPVEPRTIAPSRPSPQTLPHRQETSRPQSRPDSERRRDDTRVFTPPPAATRRSSPPQESTPTIQRSHRPEAVAPQYRPAPVQNIERRPSPPPQAAPSRPQQPPQQQQNSGSRRQDSTEPNRRRRADGSPVN